MHKQPCVDSIPRRNVFTGGDTKLPGLEIFSCRVPCRLLVLARPAKVLARGEQPLCVSVLHEEPARPHPSNAKSTLSHWKCRRPAREESSTHIHVVIPPADAAAMKHHVWDQDRLLA